jgi:methyltransferase-like protein/2-polyprenyl-3-methyl-5-hydroxy-6-metoxy-1,4-benzoquinol methylase
MLKPGPQVSSYDQVPYKSHALAYTHPASLAAVGSLFGLSAPAVEHCRILELGCATGGNAVSLALTLPGSAVVGIDASSVQIEEAQELAATVGLRNITFRCLNLLDVGKDLGEFDYILCHGVYSWVPPAVADTILSICAKHLAPRGIAYVSYNTFPGWHVKVMIREMMAFHVQHISDPERRVEEARNFLHVLAELAPEQGGIYKTILKQEESERETDTDYYFFHEYLEEINTPVYFHEFAARADAKGLQYLGPARFTPWEHHLPARTEEMLRPLSDRLLREQYLDFIGNRTFRRSLLCHAGIPMSSAPKAEAVQSLYVTGNVCPSRPDLDVASDVPEEFRAFSEARVTTNRPMVKAALTILAQERPQAVPFSDLWIRVAERLTPSKDPVFGPRGLAEALVTCAQSNLIEVRTAAASFTRTPSDRPLASSLARLQAARNEVVSNLCHQLVDVSDLERFILQHLDGAKDRDILRGLVTDAIISGDVELSDSTDTPIRDVERVHEVVAASITPALQRIAMNALLVA